ncbi:GntR family transcriptional regulator [Paroceanicella profunda]|uniref:GntR family transcriptional regulator n=1 Tax=Paroceanicella profunda TaxID=2579971 RepID=UPI0014789664|nr:GntR family transcriptional regulator [Paroceanicella profunda]
MFTDDPATGAGPIDRQPIGFDVAGRLEREIIRGDLAPGAKLVETELSARYGVSRSPLREALQIVEASGLVTRRPRYGVRVAELSVANLDDISICRVSLEATAAGLLASAPDHRAIAGALDLHVEHMRTAFAAGDFPGCFEANVRLTDHIHAALPNPVLQKLLGQLNKPALRYRYWAYLRAPETVRMLIGSNEQMTDAIRSGDGSRAETVTSGLVYDAWRQVRAALLEA